MVVVDIIPGSHTIEWSLSGYGTLVVTINVSDAGAVSCISGPCGSVTIIGANVTGNLSLTAVTSYADWVASKGGAAGIEGNLPVVGDIIDGYIQIKDLGFVVTISNVGTTIDYYLGL